MDADSTSNLDRLVRLSLETIRTDPFANDALLLASDGDLAVHYAPFEYVNRNARVILVGLTPGRHQAEVAARTAYTLLKEGRPIEVVLRLAKETASFSGPMRNNLVAMLDRLSVNRWLGIGTCEALFSDAAHLVHYMSALRYPVFKSGANYSGQPSFLSNSFLRKQFDTLTAKELGAFRDAVIVPLGPLVTSAVDGLTPNSLDKSVRVLSGLPHPSGANAERIAYFLGRKPRHALSSKTDPDRLDASMRLLTSVMDSLLAERPISPGAAT